MFVMLLSTRMRHVCLLVWIAIACFSQIAWADDQITVRDDGSVTGSIRSGISEEQTIVLSFGLPQIPAAKLWREG